MSMQGGMVGSFQSILNNIDSPAKLIYGFVIVIIIVYSSAIPSEYRSFADSLLGRVFGIAIIYGVTQGLGWVYGLLTALAFLLVINGVKTKEGFESTQVSRNRWYVEKALGEDPEKIKNHEVITNAAM